MSEVENAQSETENSESNQNDLVVIGSSAGGVEALSILVHTLPVDFPAPIVLAQHLDPSRPSTLDAILRRRSSLPVELLDSHTTIELGKIYVVPSNRHVAIKGHSVEVLGDHNKRPRPSVDLLLSTAAQVYGDRLIAVILTGSGNDGAAGAVDVKNAGGMVIVQDPQTARYPSMPLALPPTVVDFEIDLEQIGPLLYDLLTGVSLPRPEERTEDVLRGILEQVSRQASIDFRPYKTSTILRRIGRRMTITHNRTMREYLEYLRIHPEEVGELVKAFLINVTQFFRDPEAFAYLKSEILPKLIAAARERDRILRLWAAGCASGEEPYSLAMLLTDLLGAELPEWSVKIFATDLDEAAINFARRGLYSENLLNNVPPDYRERFFERVDTVSRISKMLRQMVIFGQQDLSRSAPFPRIDLVLCRNVLIYFTPQLQEYVLNQLAFSLCPSGYLFLGKAETVRPIQSYFELVNKHWKVYRCPGNVLPATRRQNSIDLNASHADSRTLSRPTRSVGKPLTEQESPPPPLEIGQLRRLNELLLRFLPMGVVVIDRSYHVLTANAAARRLLGLRDMGNEQDFLHSVRGIPYTDVRNAIDTVFRERSAVTLPEIDLSISLGGNGRFLSLSIGLMQMEAGAPDLAAISVVDVTEQVQTRRQLEAVQTEQAQLMNELSIANKRLNDVNKELLDSNEELQVANEELVLTHEELQATIEEFETTNEELQATNEELETNNEELQATNEELETTNEELRARTSELQELATMLQSERMQFAEMVELAPFSILVLRGPGLIVEAFNPRYTWLVGSRKIQGRSLDEVYDLFWETGQIEIVRLAREVYVQDTVRTTSRIPVRLLQTEGEPVESYFVYTLVPSHDANGRVSGVIIYAVDETVQRAREAEEERERLKLIFNHANAALALYDAQTAGLLIASPRFLNIAARMLQQNASELIGRRWHEITVASSIPNEQRAELWNKVLESHIPLHLPEVRSQVPPENQEMVWSYSLTPIMDMEKPDTVRFMLASAVEITEQSQARQEMEEVKHLQDEFLSFASHELRTPLTSIQGNTQLLLRYLKQQAKDAGKTAQADSMQQAIRNLESINYQTQRMNRLINEMVDLTRIRGEVLQLTIRENVDILACVRQIIEQQSATSGRSISLETNEQTIQSACDEDRLEQVLNNLINNAIKYSPSDKPVRVGVECRPENEVVIWVHDEGQGMSKEQQAHVFDEFYRVSSEETSHIEGLGLGLYIAKEIVTRIGGRMWLESTPGEGSTFYFSLPLTTDPTF